MTIKTPQILCLLLESQVQLLLPHASLTPFLLFLTFKSTGPNTQLSFFKLFLPCLYSLLCFKEPHACPHTCMHMHITWVTWPLPFNLYIRVYGSLGVMKWDWGRQRTNKLYSALSTPNWIWVLWKLINEWDCILYCLACRNLSVVTLFWGGARFIFCGPSDAEEDFENQASAKVQVHYR